MEQAQLQAAINSENQYGGTHVATATTLDPWLQQHVQSDPDAYCRQTAMQPGSIHSVCICNHIYIYIYIHIHMYM